MSVRHAERLAEGVQRFLEDGGEEAGGESAGEGGEGRAMVVEGDRDGIRGKEIGRMSEAEMAGGKGRGVEQGEEGEGVR